MTELRLLPKFRVSLAEFVGDLRALVFSQKSGAARYFGRSHSTISRYESGGHIPPAGYLAHLAQLAGKRLERGVQGDLGHYQKALLQEVNKALLHYYPHEPPFEDWQELCHIAADYMANRGAEDANKAAPAPPSPGAPPFTHPTRQREHWLGAPDVTTFYGRQQELASLEKWIMRDQCRLVGIFGLGGMGKTLVTAKVGAILKSHFDYAIWCSLLNAPPLAEVLELSIQLLSNQQEHNLPPSLDRQITLLLEYLCRHRCLLVLDNAETILRQGEAAGHYRTGYEAYGQLLRRVGETPHQSCLLLTSREKPKEFAMLAGNMAAVRTLQLTGLSVAEGQTILADKGLFGPDESWARLIHHYSGNPLTLKIAGETIRALFAGEIARFLAEGEFIFGDVDQVLDDQFNRLSPLEQELMYWLAIEREAVLPALLQQNLVRPVSRGKLLQALEALQRRSLLESTPAGFTLQNVIIEYMTRRLIEQVCWEMTAGQIGSLNNYALIRAQANEHVRQTQTRLILHPIAERLLAILENKKGIEYLLTHLLSDLRQNAYGAGYAGGNILNLLCHLGCDLSGQDFSGLRLWQAYLRGAQLQRVNFAGADLSGATFSETFGGVLSVALSADGKLAAGTAKREICLWHLAEDRPLFTCRGHLGWISAVLLSQDGRLLASGSVDQTVRLWDATTGQCRKILEGHTGPVSMIALSQDGTLLASASNDQTIRLWEVETGTCLKVLEGHTAGVLAVALSQDGKLLASGGKDQTVRLWDTQRGQCLAVLSGHINRVGAVALSRDGRLLASGSDDQTVRLWSVRTGRAVKTLLGHTDKVMTIALSQDGELLASGGDDRTVRLWEVKSGRCLRILTGHTNRVRSVAFSPSRLLASGSSDQSIRLWEVESGQCLKIWQGYTNLVWACVFSPDGRILAAGNEDRTIRLWEVATGRCLKTLAGHQGWVMAVAFSQDGRLLASGGEDQAVRLWDLQAGECRQIFRGHTGWIRMVAFQASLLVSSSDDQTVHWWDTESGQCVRALPVHGAVTTLSQDGRTLALASEDGPIRLWDVETGQPVRTLAGHTGQVWAVAWSADGQTLVSGSSDQTIRLWDAQTGACHQILRGHTFQVLSVALSQDGRLLASGGADQTVRLWEPESGACRHTLTGHTGSVRLVGLSQDGQLLASGGEDETLRLWQAQTGACLAVLRNDRPYEQMNITGATGLTAAQKASLRALGAVETNQES
jgi:WD40 repeat protein/transcriptional regulator with XRE-family HTH domain